jgi:mono/diheme cytochrome c family protein
MISPGARVLMSLAVFLWALARLTGQTQDAHPGQAPFDRACKVCHGAEGKGNAAPALVPFEMDVEELLIRVREGGGEMPPISANRVSDDEVTQIAAYLKSLAPTTDAGAPR